VLTYPQGYDCPDCGVAVGELHDLGCDVERCPHCGGQLLSDYFIVTCPDCGSTTTYSCEGPLLDDERIPWSGQWPGVEQCREFGFYAKRAPIGWDSCGKDEEGATEDLNRLYTDCTWNRETQRFELRTK
jgi:DNA-directed RNA polymerase subunit RPC12/RpoP